MKFLMRKERKPETLVLDFINSLTIYIYIYILLAIFIFILVRKKCVKIHLMETLKLLCVRRRILIVRTLLKGIFFHKENIISLS